MFHKVIEKYSILIIGIEPFIIINLESTYLVMIII